MAILSQILKPNCVDLGLYCQNKDHTKVILIIYFYFPEMLTAWLDRLELVFVGFSFYSNTARIFSTKTKKDRLDVLDGIRFLSFCWMILGNTWVMGPVYADMWLSSMVSFIIRLSTCNLHRFIILGLNTCL